MAVEIGALRALLSLDSAAFETGAARAKASMSNLKKAVSKTGATVAAVGKKMAIGFAAATTAAAFGAAAASRNLTELQNQARLAGLSAQDFKILSLASKNLGIEQEKLSDILKDVNDKFGDYAQTGGGPLKDFFEEIAPKVGLTIDSFKELSSSEALQLYVSALEEANVSQKDMTFYMEALASDATALIPLFKDNGKAMKEMAARAEELGLTLDKKTIESAAKAREQFSIVADILKTKLAVAFSEMLPVLTELAEAAIPLLVKAMDAIKPIIEIITDLLRGDFAAALDSMSEIALNVASSIRSALADLVPMAKEAIAKMGEAIIEALRGLAGRIIEAAGNLGRDLVDGLKEGINRRIDGVKTSITGAADKVTGFFKGAFETRSPSKVFMQIGRDLIDGLGLGIKETTDGVRSISENSAMHVSAPFKKVADAISQAIVHSKDLGEAFRGVVRQMAADLISSGLTSLLTQAFSGQVSGGGFLSGLFGGFRAAGGPVSFGKAYVVGERGPELFMPSASGKIIPNGVGGPVEIRVYSEPGTVAQIARNEAGRLNTHADIDSVTARIGTLLQAGRTFYVTNTARPGPKEDPEGTALGASTVTVSSVDSDNLTVNLAGLPNNYTISQGDFMCWEYGTSSVALHQVSVGDSSGPSGTTATVEVSSFVRGTPTSNVTLIAPYCKAVILPGSVSAPTISPVISSGLTFAWRQTLQ